MELSDGIDFEAWNSTVRSLSSAVDRLERTAGLLGAPPWVERLLTTLDELNLHLRQLEASALCQPGLGANPAAEEAPLLLAAEPGISAEGPFVLAADGAQDPSVPDAPHSGPSPEVPVRVPVRFGDPEAIASYGRRRRS